MRLASLRLMSDTCCTKMSCRLGNCTSCFRAFPAPPRHSHDTQGWTDMARRRSTWRTSELMPRATPRFQQHMIATNLFAYSSDHVVQCYWHLDAHEMALRHDLPVHDHPKKPASPKHAKPLSVPRTSSSWTAGSLWSSCLPVPIPRQPSSSSSGRGTHLSCLGRVCVRTSVPTPCTNNTYDAFCEAA